MTVAHPAPPRNNDSRLSIDVGLLAAALAAMCADHDDAAAPDRQSTPRPVRP